MYNMLFYHMRMLEHINGYTHTVDGMNNVTFYPHLYLLGRSLGSVLRSLWNCPPDINIPFAYTKRF